MWSRMRLSQASCSGVKTCAGLGLVHEPFVEPLGDGVGEGCEHGLLLQREADEGDEVGKAAGLRAAFDLAGRGDGEGVPEAVLGPRGVVVAQFLLQFLEHRLGEALFVRAAVEDLQGVDLGLVLLDVVAEGPGRGLRLSPSRRRRSPGSITVSRVIDVDGLLGFLLELSRGRRAARACRTGRRLRRRVACARLPMRPGATSCGRCAGLAGGAFGDRIGIEGAQQRAGEFGERLCRRRVRRRFCFPVRVEFAVEPGEAAGERGEGVFVAFAEGDAEQEFVERRRWACVPAGGSRSCRSRRRRRHRR